jgi:hypothetical protein
MWGTHQQESIEKPGARNSSFVKTKEDVDLAVDKAVESGLIILTKELVSNDSDIVHKELNCFAEGIPF